jgi:hypothetical protein
VAGGGGTGGASDDGSVGVGRGSTGGGGGAGAGSGGGAVGAGRVGAAVGWVRGVRTGSGVEVGGSVANGAEVTIGGGTTVAATTAVRAATLTDTEPDWLLSGLTVTSPVGARTRATTKASTPTLRNTVASNATTNGGLTRRNEPSTARRLPLRLPSRNAQSVPTSTTRTRNSRGAVIVTQRGLASHLLTMALLSSEAGPPDA